MAPGKHGGPFPGNESNLGEEIPSCLPVGITVGSLLDSLIWGVDQAFGGQDEDVVGWMGKLWESLGVSTDTHHDTIRGGIPISSKYPGRPT
jgi:hypothetical protein